ncbi:type IV inositol polyphosphate 5-phosphatase 3-like isoform X1 [Cucurbita pepo subsp. pepo]|uniref:type IV inositol polyphosphate 5-phosphatase 3-like isoform X1 n=1 Tax=Cucurbita pepo subsp. pepo TaxID=3664 RepID=UPI000C9D76E5|nr:type IV inositol polyphosphate 5-phosphatase 3-like isoform X1 [Cucurbita pepo subsp. pepo]
MRHNSKNQPQRTWAELCCFGCSCLQLFWPRVVLRKLLNISALESDYSADTEDDEDVNSSDSEIEAECRFRGRESRFKVDNRDEPLVDDNDVLPRLRRRNSETFRTQYINTKELRICVGTWNVGGKLPPEDLDIDGWIDTNEPADIYVLGFQEIVPLNAGNIFGAEDSRPVARWEDIIRETLNRVRPTTTKIKCFSDPPSPSKFKPFDDIPNLEEEILQESDSDVGEEVHPCDEEFFGKENGDELVRDTNLSLKIPISELSENTKSGIPVEQDLLRQYSSPKRLDRLNCLRTEDSTENDEVVLQPDRRLTKMLSGSERIGLCWPEPPLHLLPHIVLERPNSFKSIKSFKASKSFGKYNSFKSTMNEMPSGVALLGEIDLESLLKRKRRSSYVRIVSKQMVGIFLTIWVRKSLRRHIQNVNVSTVGVGVMGYIGNKGSISVSMSIYQTLFCFICTHLTSGEKEGDELKRNADVSEIHRRTSFHPLNGIGFPKVIHDHERIIWLGDLNYRINLSYEKTRELISRKEWSRLAESDQLLRELKKGRTFDGWTEGNLNFPPTYKYENNSEKYCGEDPKVGRRTPAWCDRILSYGKGLKLCNYRRTEINFSDHRPVTATYVAEVEVFCPRKLQRALTFTDAEIEKQVAIDVY